MQACQCCGTHTDRIAQDLEAGMLPVAGGQALCSACAERHWEIQAAMAKQAYMRHSFAVNQSLVAKSQREFRTTCAECLITAWLIAHMPDDRVELSYLFRVEGTGDLLDLIQEPDEVGPAGVRYRALALAVLGVYGALETFVTSLTGMKYIGEDGVHKSLAKLNVKIDDREPLDLVIEQLGGGLPDGNVLVSRHVVERVRELRIIRNIIAHYRGVVDKKHLGELNALTHRRPGGENVSTDRDSDPVIPEEFVPLSWPGLLDYARAAEGVVFALAEASGSSGE